MSVIDPTNWEQVRILAKILETERIARIKYRDGDMSGYKKLRLQVDDLKFQLWGDNVPESYKDF